MERSSEITSSSVHLRSPKDVLNFWFDDFFASNGLASRNTVSYIQSRFPLWFSGSCEQFELTQKNSSQLLASVERAHLKDRSNLTDWNGPHGTLAKIIVFDQFPRSMFRGTADAFKYDVYAKECIDNILLHDDWYLNEYSAVERLFIIIALQHGESIEVQELGVSLAATMCDGIDNPELKYFFDNLPGFPHQHHDVIKRFGRFPGRNAALGRESTAAETEWLNSSECPNWAMSQVPK